jgi:hypothetical protein
MKSHSSSSTLKALTRCHWGNAQNFCGLFDGEIFPIDERDELFVGLTETLERLADIVEGVAGVRGIENPDREAEPIGGLQATCVSSPVVGEATSSGAQQPRQRGLIIGGHIAEPTPRRF